MSNLPNILEHSFTPFCELERVFFSRSLSLNSLPIFNIEVKEGDRRRTRNA